LQTSKYFVVVWILKHLMVTAVFRKTTIIHIEIKSATYWKRYFSISHQRLQLHFSRFYSHSLIPVQIFGLLINSIAFHLNLFVNIDVPAVTFIRFYQKYDCTLFHIKRNVRFLTNDPREKLKFSIHIITFADRLSYIQNLRFLVE
jgi:hypothetical protein